MRFAKLHGAGNDYIYVNGLEEKVLDPAALAVKISDRHFGVGADGLILVLPPRKDGDVRMRMFNVDGSESEMCGNGVRCLAKFAAERGLVKGPVPCAPAAPCTVRVETEAGLREVRLLRDASGRITRGSVGMGRPRLEAALIPVSLEGERVVDVPLTVGGRTLWMTCVNMGNPHAVFYVDGVDGWPLEEVGPKIERHPLFPERVNVHIVQVVSLGEVRMRTWERGSGLTLACGTGASAVCVAGVLTGRSARRILVHVPGGDLEVEWPDDAAPVTLTGPVDEVFTGEWPE
ncbi:MAG: diaminopimelate epimerase [Planctomycetes bacterium]|nr:diaminopimelate epimerase [Planctomycetota bacterium]